MDIGQVKSWVSGVIASSCDDYTKDQLICNATNELIRARERVARKVFQGSTSIKKRAEKPKNVPPPSGIFDRRNFPTESMVEASSKTLEASQAAGILIDTDARRRAEQCMKKQLTFDIRKRIMEKKNHNSSLISKKLYDK